MHYKIRRRYKVRKYKLRRKRQNRFGTKSYLRAVFYNLVAKEKRGSAFPFATLLLVALKAVSTLL